MIKRKKAILAVIITLAIALSAFLVWAETPLGPMPEALAALQSDSQVLVSADRWLVFTPIGTKPEVGFIIYPGGRVDFRSYAPAAHAIANHGFLVVIVPMPLNLAVFSPDSASDVITTFREIKSWAVGGHSLGGSMAAQFIRGHASTAGGLVLWASYPASDNDLSKSSLKVISISGTRDGLATPDKISSSRSLLPPDTKWIVIVGGNHAQFGWYGPQPGDNPADISREEQQRQVVEYTVGLLKELAMPDA